MRGTVLLVGNLYTLTFFLFHIFTVFVQYCIRSVMTHRFSFDHFQFAT